MKRPLIAGLVGLVACGAPGHPNHDSVPPPAVVLHESDFGRTITLAVGQEIRLQLIDARPVPGSSTTWDASSSLPAVLEVTNQVHERTAAAGDGSYVATLVARAPGSAAIDVRGLTTCEAMAKTSCPDRTAVIAVRIVRS